jgi:hypothetical protein
MNKISRARDVRGESMDALMGSCSQNTLKNERLEHQSYRQERKFIDRERLSPGVGGYLCVRLPP